MILILNRIWKFPKLSVAILIICCFILMIWSSPNSLQPKRSSQIAEHTTKNYVLRRNINATEKLSEFALPTLIDDLSYVLNCTDRRFTREVQAHGNYTLLKNFARASRRFKCYETVTYTTHCDFNFLLDNVNNLLQRWNTALSIAIYSPGNDFYSALNRILWLRNCIDESELIRELVSFSLFFENDFAPVEFDGNFSNYETIYECIEPLEVMNTFKNLNHLTYPINVARNLARNASSTHYVLSSDVELYPSLNFVEMFFDMVKKNPEKYLQTRRVYVLPVFEVDESIEAPESKSQLVEEMKNNKVFWFHEKICASCHRIPHSEEWIAENSNSPDMNVSFAAKRVGPFGYWEPIFVGTHDDPLFDERLNWEGKSDKMSQNYIMCLLEYEYDILSNAFLVHKPGVKTLADAARPLLEDINRHIISTQILPEIDSIYGTNDECRII